MKLVDVVNLVSSLASSILAVIAILLALHFYDKSKDSEKQTEVNVNEIKTQTAALTNISSRMLDKYTDYATSPKAADESFLIITQLLGQVTSARVSAYPDNGTQAQLERFTIDVSIVALFYSGLANLATQDLLPQNASDIDSDSGLPNILNASKKDFDDLAQRLASLDESLLSTSHIYNLYQFALGWIGSGQIKDISTLYVPPSDSPVT